MRIRGRAGVSDCMMLWASLCSTVDSFLFQTEADSNHPASARHVVFQRVGGGIPRGVMYLAMCGCRWVQQVGL